MTDPRTTDPNTPPEDLLGLAGGWPEEVLQNPVLPLLALSDPLLWSKIIGKARLALATQGAKNLLAQRDAVDSDTCFEWRTDCLGRVAEVCHPELRPIVRYLAGELWAGREEPQIEIDLKRKYHEEGWRDRAFGAGEPATAAAIWATLCMSRDSMAGPKFCGEAVAMIAIGRGEVKDLAWAIEAEWQLARLVELVREQQSVPRPREAGIGVWSPVGPNRFGSW